MRPTPTAQVLKNLDLKGKEITTLVASGSHRPPGPSDIQKIFGGDIPPYGGRIAVHNCRDTNSLMRVGRTSRGTELSFNSLLSEADGIISLGSVEPHYFAGFTGGRKFLLPALAGFDSIAMNHSLAVEESARVLALEGNPVHEDFMEALRIFGRHDDIFSIQLVLNQNAEISYAFSGDITTSFEHAVSYSRDIYAPKVRKKADIVISVNEPPLDIDLYQSQKAIDNVKLAVNEGGIIILVSKCREGIGDEHFYKFLTSETGTNAENRHKFGYHKAVKLRNVLNHVSIFAVTTLPSSIPRAIGLMPYAKVEDALKDATRIKGRDSNVLIVLNGANTVPLPSMAS
jgi:nickel-dependent lactate racemase